MSEDIILSSIIEREVLSFDDVSRFDEATITEKVLSAGRNGTGIRISEEDDGLVITLDIIVYYGVNIPQLCYDIQTRLKKTLGVLTGSNVRAINIKVEGIDERPKDQER